MIGEIDDLALRPAVDRAVRRIDKAGHALRMPVIAAGLALVAIHALLHHDPFAVIGDDEAVQIEIEAVLHRGAIDLGDQLAGAHQILAVEAEPVAKVRSSSGVLRECSPRPPQTWMPSSLESGFSPRFRAPITLVVMPDECQSIPMTAPNDWNQ